MKNGLLQKILIGALTTVLVAMTTWILALSMGSANAKERIRANEVRVEGLEKRFDRFEDKLDSIITAVGAKRP